MRPALQVLPYCVLFALAQAQQDHSPLYRDDFEGAPVAWEFSDAAAWALVPGKAGQGLGLVGKSAYVPPQRSPANLALLKDIWLGDFALELSAKSTTAVYDHRDLCLIFGYQDPTHYYYAHLGQRTDEHANQIFVVDGAPRAKISTLTNTGTPWGDSWHRLRLERELHSGRIALYFDDFAQPVMLAEDQRFVWGRVGLGSFDDQGTFDEFELHGEKLVARPELLETWRFLGALQLESGAFRAQRSSSQADLNSTTQALRALHSLQAPLPRADACLQYVLACYDAEKGAFAQTPGAAEDALATAVGLMALVELNAHSERAAACQRYLYEKASTPAEIYLACAALESAGLKCQGPEGWIAPFATLLAASASTDMDPYASAGAVIALLRMEVELAELDSLTERLCAAQRQDGGFGPPQAPSDLPSTYRLVRSLKMLGQPPRIEACRAFLASCKNQDGGFAAQPGQESTVGATYQAASVSQWLREFAP